jgi:hypothetical protein
MPPVAGQSAGAPVWIEHGAVNALRPPASPHAHVFGWMRAQVARRTLSVAPRGVPLIEFVRGACEGAAASDGVEEVGVVVNRASDVLTPQAQPRLACEQARAIPEAARIDGRTNVSVRVDY